MSPDEAKAFIEGKISVPRINVTIAKAYILENFNPNTDKMIEAFLRSKYAEMPKQVVLHSTVDPEPMLNQAADSISWRLAICEAIWNLISQNAVFPIMQASTGMVPGIGYTTAIPGGGGTSGGLPSFDDELSIPVPSCLTLPASAGAGEHQPLTCPDLYLKEVDLSDLDPTIEQALREAVRCFRYELYLASLAMLGRASEAAWIELGFSLLRAAPSGTSINVEKKLQDLESPYVGIAKKIQTVIDLHSKPDFENLSRAAGVRHQDLKAISIWADCVRESRNSLHYGAEPAMSNGYEKVAAFLIGAVPHLRALWSLRQVAAASATNVSTTN